MSLLASAVFATVGLVSIAGGVIGYKKAKSRASLIAGGISGVLLLAAAGCVTAGMTTTGLALGGLTSVALAARFAPAFKKTGKWMPQGLMAVLSGAGAAAAAAGFLLK